MTIYEQIQDSIDYIEENLQETLSCSEAAKKANMSLRNFYNYFWAITGLSYGEYLRKRRLSLALELLKDTDTKVLDVALDCGYGSHESFSRAFRKEFKTTPTSLRKYRLPLHGLGQLNIIKERYMNVIVKELSKMTVVSYTGFSPDPEMKAQDRIGAWANKNGYGELYGPESLRPYRNFGHDTDSNGRGYTSGGDSKNYGYRVLMSITEEPNELDDDLSLETFDPGKYLVTGVEGNLEEGFDFIPKGWDRLIEMANQKGHRIKEYGRRFEEKLEPQRAGNTRLDLYIEIE